MIWAPHKIVRIVPDSTAAYRKRWKKRKTEKVMESQHSADRFQAEQHMRDDREF